MHRSCNAVQSQDNCSLLLDIVRQGKFFALNLKVVRTCFLQKLANSWLVNDKIFQMLPNLSTSGNGPIEKEIKVREGIKFESFRTY